MRLQYSNQRQIVTGLIVNNKLRVNKKLINELELAIYYIDRFGINNHKNFIKSTKFHYKEHLYGIAYYINQVNNELGRYYLTKLNDLRWDDV